MQDRSKWKLIREVGIEREDGGGHVFRMPLSAVPCRRSGAFFVVDHRKEGDALFRSAAGGLARHPLGALRDPVHRELVISMRGDGGMLVLSGSDPREIVLLDPDGAVRARYFEGRGRRAGGRLVWPVSLAPLGEDVLAGFGSPGFQPKMEVEVGVAVLAPDGRRTWEWVPGPGVLGHATHLTPVPSGFVLTDVTLHQVMRVGWDGRVEWTFGTRERAGNDRRSFNHPMGTSLTPAGTLLVADTHNDRIVELSLEGRLLGTLEPARDDFGARTGPLVGPGSVHSLAGGDLLVAETGNSRVVTITRAGRVLQSAGSPAVRRRLLSFPRSIQRLATRDWLVADTNNDRVVALGEDNGVQWQIGGERCYAGAPLKWPRCARLLRDGSVLVADSGNCRLLLIGRDGETRAEVREVVLPGGVAAPLSDPHCLYEAGRGNWLLVDSDLDLVCMIDAAGKALWALGGPGSEGVLSDPHQILRSGPGTYLVADRWGLATVTLEGRMVERRNTLPSAAGGEIRLGAVRSLLATPRMTILSDNVAPSRLVVVDHATKTASVVDELQAGTTDAGPEIRRFGGPRWLARSSGGRVMLSDYSTHRLIEIAPVGARAGHPEPH